MDEVKHIISTLQPHLVIEVPQQVVPSPPSLTRAMSYPPNTFVEEEVQTSQPWRQPEQSASIQSPPESKLATTQHLSCVEDHGIISPVRPTSQIPAVQPAPAISGKTTPRRMTIRNRALHRRRVRPAYTVQVTQQLLQAEESWRQFKAQQLQDYLDLRREENRIREMEIETQRRWQSLGMQALDMLDKLVSKYCKE